MNDSVVNLNVDAKTLEQCLKATSNYGETLYRNICTGTVTSVPWGTVDWALAIVLTSLGVALLGVLLVGCVAFLRDW